MVMRYICIAFICTLFSLNGCAESPRADGLDADKFNSYYHDQRKCNAYVDSLVNPVADGLKKNKTIGEMRAWVRGHPHFVFSKLVERVQMRATKEGALDPRRESDQVKVTRLLFEEMNNLPGFDQSACDVDVRDSMMESLYSAIGGEGALVSEQLRNIGVKGHSEQRWVLLVALMAGELVPGLI